MPGRPRQPLPGMPYHVRQRYQVSLHAYMLMTNHVHVLIRKCKI